MIQFLLCVGLLASSPARLPHCKNQESCVNSNQSGTSYYIKPLEYRSVKELQRIAKYFEDNYSVEIIKQNHSYLHLVVSEGNIKEDVEFLVQSRHGTIAVRAAIRDDQRDSGKARERIEALRKFLKSQ